MLGRGVRRCICSGAQGGQLPFVTPHNVDAHTVPANAASGTEALVVPQYTSDTQKSPTHSKTPSPTPRKKVETEKFYCCPMAIFEARL